MQTYAQSDTSTKLKAKALARSLLAGVTMLTCLSLSAQAATENKTAEVAKRDKLVLAGPSATVSLPLTHMVESGALKDIADNVEFVLWNNPDQLRALTLDKKADFVAMPTNVAANLYNRGVPLQLANVSTWGILWMVSRDPDLKTLADFKGQEIAIPFRADMPDIIFSYLTEKSGLDPHKDFKIRYSATPMDAMQQLVMRQVDHALLAEPAISMALRKTGSFPLSVVAPDLYRSVDLQKEWGRLQETEARIPQAGMVVIGETRLDDALVDRLEKAYAQSSRWCFDNAQACGEIAAKYIPALTSEAISDAVAVIPQHYAVAQDARPELEQFYTLLHSRQPALIGNKLPDDGFYSTATKPAP
ncbi:ABC transporter substrate-binding protein [Orrella sp. 11846]|uniref:ABC transporter substrate-binding protein n=1 Tax=Orrella sp. 11846 TaxID=3409913 RepID=UPI003B599FC6